MYDTTADLTPDLLAPAHALNQQFATELSSTTAAELAELIEAAAYARCVGQVDGFLLAFDETAAIEGENFAWFKTRYGRFLYVDRIAVAAHAQGRGVARRLYGDLIAWATARDIAMLACEVNIRPPNPASDALHGSLGFAEVGQAELRSGKRVRYLVRRLAGSDERRA